MNCSGIARARGMWFVFLTCCMAAGLLILTAAVGPSTLRPGGVSFALADATHQITFTDSSGTFIAPASGGTSGAATGGGTWATFEGSTKTGSGTYTVTGL